jgi:hypothetical protein
VCLLTPRPATGRRVGLFLQVFGTTMWGTREPPEWLARRWKRKRSNDNQGEGENEENGEGEGKQTGEGEGDPVASEAGGEGDVEAGGQGGGSCCGGRRGIRLPPVPKIALPEVRVSSATTVDSRRLSPALPPCLWLGVCVPGLTRVRRLACPCCRAECRWLSGGAGARATPAQGCAIGAAGEGAGRLLP